jgi:hypothetical protein
VRAAATATHPAQSLDARALIRPLAAWPLGALDASVRALDLSAFASALPATALTGEARATTSGLDVPATVSVALANARAGRWNEGLLPVRRLRAELRARPDDPRRRRSAGAVGRARLGGKCRRQHRRPGRWARPDWNVDVELRQVQPAALDARAGSAVVSGKAAFTGTGFAAVAAATPSASAPAPSGSAAPARARRPRRGSRRPADRSPPAARGAEGGTGSHRGARERERDRAAPRRGDARRRRRDARRPPRAREA